jgi:nickel-dependent lactate racemase
MTSIELGFGDETIKLSLDEPRFKILTTDEIEGNPLSDLELGEALTNPIYGPSLDDICSAGDSVLIVVSDATRATGSAQLVNLLVRRLIQSGVAASDIGIIFATGIHRPVTPQEKSELLTPFIAQRIKTIDHDAYDASQMVALGSTERGTPVEVNRALKEYSRVILTGGIGFHYFAGFTGGRKSICPGLASAQTIEATHMLALDFETGQRRQQVETGRLTGNPVHEECERIAAIVDPHFSINTIVDERGRAVGLYAGDWKQAHHEACQAYLDRHSVQIDQRRDLVIVSCGGYPYDINLIQAHKALEMATHACNEGGAIILLAQCRDGFGRNDFLKWFEEADSTALAARLVEGYEVNGQTAWSLLTKSERYRVFLVSGLPDEAVRLMRMMPASSLSEALASVDKQVEGYVMPRGAALLPRVKTDMISPI